jgi:hypothetical protein
VISVVGMFLLLIGGIYYEQKEIQEKKKRTQLINEIVF